MLPYLHNTYAYSILPGRRVTRRRVSAAGGVGLVRTRAAARLNKRHFCMRQVYNGSISGADRYLGMAPPA